MLSNRALRASVDFLWLPLIIAFVCVGIAHAQTGSGLTGKYYDTDSFGTLKTTRTDATVDFNFGTSIPAGTALTSSDTFSVVWSGRIEPEFSELYTFYLTIDDGARLWIDDQCLVSRTFYQSQEELRGQIRLKAGHRVNIRIEYIEKTGAAKVKLEWASASQTRQVVPQARLYPTTEAPNGGCVIRETWTNLPGTDISSISTAPNFPNRPASRETLTSLECLAQNWEDNYGTRITGWLRAPVTGTYQFAASGDEVVQFHLSTDDSVSNKSIIAQTTGATAFRQWDAQPSQQSTPRTLVAGREYYFEVWHKEATGSDHFSIGWKKPGASAYSVISGTPLVMNGTKRTRPAQSALFDTLATEQPRILATKERFLWLKQQYELPGTNPVKTRVQNVINTANSALAGTSVDQGIEARAIAWWVTGNNAYADSVWAGIQSRCTGTGDWNYKFGPMNSYDVGIALDWFYPYWNATQRATMANAIIAKGKNWPIYTNNIGLVHISCSMIGALAVGTADEPGAEALLNKAHVEGLGGTGYIADFTSNGGTRDEGTMYAVLAKLYLGPAMAGLESALGTTWEYGNNPGLALPAREQYYSKSNGGDWFTFSDVGMSSKLPGGWLNWWARRFEKGESWPICRSRGSAPINTLMITDETSPSHLASQPPPDMYFRGPIDGGDGHFKEAVTLRGNWNDTKATFVGTVGGAGTFSHGMLEDGTFQINARGLGWFSNLSSDDYNAAGYFDTSYNGGTPYNPYRWDYYRCRAEGHNTLVINPGSGPDRITTGIPAVMNYQSSAYGDASFSVLNMTPTISGATRVHRGIKLFNKRQQVLIQDEIVMSTASTVWWFAHFNNTKTTATLGPDGTSVTLQQGSERLWGRILTSGSVFTVRPADPLPSTPAHINAYSTASNSKLSINLTGVTNTTLAVWFVPLAPGEDPPATLPAVTPLASWNIFAENGAPIASNSSVSSTGTAPVNVALSTYASDDWTPSTRMTYAVSAPVGGSVSLLPDGITARFTPTPGFTGLQSFAFTATDADGATSNTGTISFSLPPVVTNWTSATSGNWNTGTLWQGGVAPASSPGSEIQFFSGQTIASGTITATNNLAATTDLNRLTLAGTGTSTTIVNLSGNALKLVGNGIIAPVVTLSGNTAGFRYQVANNITLAEDTTFNASGSGTFHFSGALGGTGGITRNSSTATLILSGNNTYAGPTTINAGTLQIGNDGATGTLGNGPVSIASGATLRIDRTGSLQISNSITGAGRIIVNGAATTDVVSLSGDNDFTGEVRVENGSLRISDASQLGSGTKTISIISTTTALLRLDGSSAPVVLPAEFSLVTSNPNGTILNEAGDNEILGDLTLGPGGGGTRITVAAGSLTLGGTITPTYSFRTLDLRGAGIGIINGNFIDGADAITGFTKNDAGTWTLNGNNAISSATTVSAGKLVINGSHASGAVSVASAATLSGRGSLTAATTVTGTLAPGDGIGTMNFGSTLSFGSASKLQWEIASNSTVADQAIATGSITVTSGAKIDLVLNRPGSTVNLLNSFWRNARTFPVITGSSLSGAFSIGTITTDAGGRPVSTYGSFTLQTTATGTNLVWTPIPGFPIYNDPVVTITSPASQPVSIIDAEHELHVSATSDGGPSAPMLWSMVSGPEAVDFDNPAAATTRVHFTDAGSYVLRCTALNAGGSGSRDFTVEVAPATTELSLREGVNSVSTPATFIRGDSATWNSGARDQIIVGRNAGSGYRGLLSFPIPPELNGSVITGTSLNLTVSAGGSGIALGTLELQHLAGTFTEGTGDGSVATNGAGTGADWLNRSYTPATPWAAAGGSAGTDYENATLSTAAGFNPTTTPGGTAVTFDTTPEFISAAAKAAGTSQPLGLFLKMTGDTSAGALFARFASDDHATLDWRPELRITHYPHLAPILDPGTITTAATGTTVALTGSATNGIPAGWTYVSGPASPIFLTSFTTSANLLFTQPGTYLLRFTGTNAHGESSRLLAIEVTGSALTGLELWRFTNFGSIENSGAAADLSDFDNDGIANILEYVLNGNPTSSDSAILPTLNASGPNFVFTFTRRDASETDTTQSFQYGTEPGTWTSVILPAASATVGSVSITVTESGASPDTVYVSIPKTVAAPGGKLFGRLRVTQP